MEIHSLLRYVKIRLEIFLYDVEWRHARKFPGERVRAHGAGQKIRLGQPVLDQSFQRIHYIGALNRQLRLPRKLRQTVKTLLAVRCKSIVPDPGTVLGWACR